MTLQQLSAVKRWHINHPRSGSVEVNLWDAVLTCWVLGWMGLAPAAVLSPQMGLPLCAALSLMPSLYVQLRRRLHQRGRLRCDWLSSARRDPAA